MKPRMYKRGKWWFCADVFHCATALLPELAYQKWVILRTNGLMHSKAREDYDSAPA